MNYYNEFDPKAAAWLRELISEGLIPYGTVDERSITEVSPTDLTGYTQCHFFAGIGGWPYALRLAGWPGDQPVWTGSCPCQPFSCAGKGLGEADERHLWPVFRELIRACKPTTVFGEQVASKAGRDWLAGVFADLEGMAYQRAGADLCAAGVGAPHIRQRLFWCGMDNTTGARLAPAGIWAELRNERGRECLPREGCELGGMADAELRRSEQCNAGQRSILRPDANGTDGRLEHSALPEEARLGQQSVNLFRQASFWSSAIWHQCRDGKARRISPEPALFPLAYGLPGRVGLLRGAGNAIVPQVAATFIQAAVEAIREI